MRLSFGDSAFCNRYRGTSGLLGRFVLFLDRLWLKRVVGLIKSDLRKLDI
jgi:hypothetical protein